MAPPERLRVMTVIARMNLGGPAVIASELARNLDPDRFEHQLVIGDVGDDEGDYLVERDPELAARRVAGLGRSLKARDDAAALAGLRRAMREFRPHIVHTHTSKAGALGRMAAWTSRVPATVHTFHGHHLHGYFSAPVTRAIAAFERTMAWRTTRLISVGAQVRDELLAARIGRPEQYTVIAPGVRLSEPPARADARRLLQLPLDAPVVSYIGRLTSIKRPDRLLDVIERVAREVPGAICIVVGKGDLAETVERDAAQRGLDRSMRFLGWRADVEVLFAASDLTLLTSDNEGMPVSLIEAARCGRPAVATRVGSVSEVIVHEQTGLLAPPTDTELLAQHVIRLLSDLAQAASMGAAARARADELFSARRLVADIAAVYESIARERGWWR